MRLAFLLGSGASLRAGMPSTRQITNAVLTGTNVRKSTDGHYFIDGETRTNPAEMTDIEICRVLATFVHSYIEQFYETRRTHPTNYENIAYVLTQVAETISREIDNPAVEAFVHLLMACPEIEKTIQCRDLGEMAQEAANYVADIAWSLCRIEPQTTDYLRFILEANGERTDGTYVFTLNHDLVLERFLESQRVHFADGFGEPKGNVRYWENSLDPEAGSGVVVAKLHGSVNWFVFDTHAGQEPVIPVGDANHLLDEQGRLLPVPVHPRPALLLGTFNKMYSYTSGIFADLHCCFHRVLRDTSTLISVGYGFGDKGINTKLVQWLNTSFRRRLVVVHPDPCSLRGCARGAIIKDWDDWKQNDRLVEVQMKAEELSWRDHLQSTILSESEGP